MAKDLNKKFAKFRKKKIGEEELTVPEPSKPPKVSMLERFKEKAKDRKEQAAHMKELKKKIKDVATETKTEKKPLLKGWKRDRKLKKLESKVKDAKTQHKKVEQAETKDIRKTLQKQKKKRVKITAAQRRRSFKTFLEMAGWEHILPHEIARDIFRVTIGLLALGTAYALLQFSIVTEPYALSFIFTIVGVIWTLGFILALLILWMIFYLILDLRMFRRKLSVELVLPDFLQLASANIRAGMPIDQALWYAVRPRFGVLAKEIETVAKETLSGSDLNAALEKFAQKYDSVILKRSMNLMIEGINAGGEIGDLMNKISLNIQETRIMKKEMAASVTTYVIFIGFATGVAAPVLFALAYQLLNIIKNITGKLADTNVGSAGALSFSVSGDAVSLGDFQIFAITSLIMTSFFSSLIIAIIKKGSVKEGISYIPVFITITLIVYWIARKILGGALGGLI